MLVVAEAVSRKARARFGRFALLAASPVFSECEGDYSAFECTPLSEGALLGGVSQKRCDAMVAKLPSGTTVSECGWEAGECYCPMSEASSEYKPEGALVFFYEGESETPSASTHAWNFYGDEAYCPPKRRAVYVAVQPAASGGAEGSGGTTAEGGSAGGGIGTSGGGGS